MKYYQWQHVPKARIYTIIFISSLYFVIPSIIILLIEETPRLGKITLLLRIIGSTVILIVGLLTLLYGYRKAIRSEIYSKKIVIPIHISEDLITPKGPDIAYSYYSKFTNKIEDGLKHHKFHFKKRFSHKGTNKLLYKTWFKIYPYHIYIRIDRKKYGIVIVVSNLISGNELLFEQTIRKIIDDAIKSVENPFDK